jgi:hypothetical protein
MTPMYSVTVYEPRSGLSRDYEIAALTPKLIIQQFDAKYLYDREYEVEAQLANGRWLYRYRKTTKRRLALA